MTVPRVELKDTWHGGIPGGSEWHLLTSGRTVEHQH